MSNAPDRTEDAAFPTIHGRFAAVDGAIVPWDQARVPVFDHGLLHGDGCFESLAIHGGRVFMLDAHLARLDQSVRALGIRLRVEMTDLSELMAELVSANELDDALVKVVVTRGAGTLTMDPRGLTPTVIVLAEPMQTLVGEAEEQMGLRLKTAAIRRPPPWVLDAKIKSLNYLNPILARLEALASEHDDALLLDEHGAVCEATGYNVFVIHGSRVATPSSSAILRGITRSVLLELAVEADFQAIEEQLTLADVYGADEVFLSSTAGGVIPVREVDGRVPRAALDRPVTSELKRRYDAALMSPERSIDLNALRAPIAAANGTAELAPPP